MKAKERLKEKVEILGGSRVWLIYRPGYIYRYDLKEMAS